MNYFDAIDTENTVCYTSCAPKRKNKVERSKNWIYWKRAASARLYAVTKRRQSLAAVCRKWGRREGCVPLCRAKTEWLRDKNRNFVKTIMAQLSMFLFLWRTTEIRFGKRETKGDGMHSTSLRASWFLTIVVPERGCGRDYIGRKDGGSKRSLDPVRSSMQTQGRIPSHLFRRGVSVQLWQKTHTMERKR